MLTMKQLLRMFGREQPQEDRVISISPRKLYESNGTYTDAWWKYEEPPIMLTRKMLHEDVTYFQDCKRECAKNNGTTRPVFKTVPVPKPRDYDFVSVNDVRSDVFAFQQEQQRVLANNNKL